MLTKRGYWILIVLVAAAAGGWAYRQHHRFKNFSVHQPGVVYRSGWMEADALAETIQEHEIRTVVNLCQPTEMTPQLWAEERRAVKRTGARLLEMPMPHTVAPTNPVIQQYVDLLRDPDNYPLLVHCQHGVRRTAKFIAMYDLLSRDLSASKSLSAQPLFGREAHTKHVKTFAKNFENHHRNRHQAAKPHALNTPAD